MSGDQRDADSFPPRRSSDLLADMVSGNREEKTFLWIDPAQCKMWAEHDRDYALLDEHNCADLIDGIKSQGKQEFRSEEHTSELQSPDHLVSRLLLEKKKKDRLNTEIENTASDAQLVLGHIF